MNRRGSIPILLIGLILCCAAPGFVFGQHKPPRIGLVLSGGGARAASHIGILKVLEREKIPIYCIAATSFGALVGGLYSIGYSTGDIEKILAEQDWDGIFSDAPQRRLTRLIDRRNARYQGQLSFNGWNPELPTGLWEGQRLTETLDTLTTRQLLQARYDFDNLPIRFRAIATNLVDGTTYVFKQGSMTMALRASMAIPLLFKPVEKDGMLLADGGLSNNLPADVARAMGADIIIAVDATTPLLTKEEIRTFVDVIDQSISLQIERNVQESRKLANIVLQPDLEKYSNSDYSRIPEIVKIGEESAERHLEELKALAAGIPPHERSGLPEGGTPVIDTISFRGLKNIQPAQLKKNLRVQSGDSVDPARIGADVGRLYATRLFDSISYSLEPVGENRYQLVFTVKEALLRTLGASLRYDSDYTFVALAEFTARQLFHSPTTATVSAQFGGMEDHFASLRLTPANAQFFFVEPRLEARRLERQDIRDRNLVDKFTDNREAVQLMIGATISRQLDMCAGFRAERVEISGGSEPNRLAGSNAQVGFVFRLNRDSLDSQDFPRNGMLARAQFDKRNVSLGGDFDNSKFQAEYQRYFTFSGKSTFRIHAAVGYTHGEVPFYDLFYVGGYSFSESASRQFLGLERDELPVRQMGMLGAGYRRRLFSNPISFIRQGFLLGIYNGIFSSTRKESPYDFDLLHGAGISLALDTLVGPFHATGGWAEGGRFHFYISFGPAF